MIFCCCYLSDLMILCIMYFLYLIMLGLKNGDRILLGNRLVRFPLFCIKFYGTSITTESHSCYSYLGYANSNDIFAHNFKNINDVCIIKYFLETTHMCKHFKIYYISCNRQIFISNHVYKQINSY